MVLAYQRSFNGLTVGDGTDYSIVRESGLSGFSVRVGDQAIPRGDGDFPGLHLRDPKELFLELELADDSGTAVEGLLDDVLAAFQPVRDPSDIGQYTFNNGSGDFFVRARPTRIEVNRDASTNWITTVPIALQCADPFVYAGNPTPVVGGTLISIDGTAETDTIFNAGLLPAQVQMLVAPENAEDPAISAFTVENLTSGITFTYDANLVTGAPNIEFGDTFRVQAGDQNPQRDPGEEWVVFNHLGVESAVPGWVPPRIPLTMLPGNNSIRFTPTVLSTPSASSLVIVGRETY